MIAWWVRTALGGLVGAAAASVACKLIGALAFATHRTHLPIAGSPETRALGQVLVGVGTAPAAKGPVRRRSAEGESGQ
jgi:hypothetical protein